MTLACTIRRYRPGDAPAMNGVFARSVAEVASRCYGPDQITAWLRRGLSSNVIAHRMTDGRVCFIAESETGEILGFIDLEPDGHIDLMFCAPEAVGKGVAHALYAAMEDHARQRRMARLFTEASESARNHFLKQGFTLIARRDFDIEGVPVHNYAMEKRLA
jgi:putative acetyltransferase